MFLAIFASAETVPGLGVHDLFAALPQKSSIRKAETIIDGPIHPQRAAMETKMKIRYGLRRPSQWNIYLFGLYLKNSKKSELYTKVPVLQVLLMNPNSKQIDVK